MEKGARGKAKGAGRGERNQLGSTPAAKRPAGQAVVVGSIPTSSISGAQLKTSLILGSWRQYTCYTSSRARLGTPLARDAFVRIGGSDGAEHRYGEQLEADGAGSQQWRAVGAGPAHVYTGDTK